MARQRTPDPIDGLFDREGHERKVNRLLDKAVAKRVRDTQKAGRAVLRLPQGQGKKSNKSGLSKALGKALSSQFGGKGRASTRKSAPDTGGRSFHFAYYSVAKGDARAHPATGKPTVKASSRKTTAGGAHAHQSYIERESAVEILNPITLEIEERIAALPARSRGRPTKEQEEERQNQIREIEMEVLAKTMEGGRAAAAQAYIEDPTKLLAGDHTLSSFGNIGKTSQERSQFWDLVEAYEPRPDGRIQNRMIIELPHQSTPEARLEIMKRFVKPLEDLNLPYHVAIHAPTKKNDGRNFHAHVVYSERPAQKMLHPDTGENVWDFTIEKKYKTKSRNTKISHPFRQNRAEATRDIHFVRKLRKDVATIVTDVMKDVDPAVKFDARSYKDMGLDVQPMLAINRVLHDRMRDGALVVHDRTWTKRMMEAELEAAAQRRDPDAEKIIQTARGLEALQAAYPNVAAVNKTLTWQSRIVTLAGFTKPAFERIVTRRLRLEAEIAKERLLAKAEIEVCQKIIAATRDRDRKSVGRQDAYTDVEKADLALIHTTAKEELAAVRLRLKQAERVARARIAKNKDDWKARSGPTFFHPVTGRDRVEEAMAARHWPGSQPAAPARPADEPPKPKLPPGRPGAFITPEMLAWEGEDREAKRRDKSYISRGPKFEPLPPEELEVLRRSANTIDPDLVRAKPSAAPAADAERPSSAGGIAPNAS